MLGAELDHSGGACCGLNPIPQIYTLKSQTLGPQNVTVFGDGVFKKAIKLLGWPKSS